MNYAHLIIYPINRNDLKYTYCILGFFSSVNHVDHKYLVITSELSEILEDKDSFHFSDYSEHLENSQPCEYLHAEYIQSIVSANAK